MKRVKTVGVRNLKDKLSAYLREIQSGSIVLITDRGTVVAELREPSVARMPPGDGGLDDWLRDGRLAAPRAAKARCPRSPVRVAAGSAAALLDQERAQ